MKININEKQIEDGSYLFEYDFDKEKKSTEIVIPSLAINNDILAQNRILSRSILQGGLYFASNNILETLFFISNLYDKFISTNFLNENLQEELCFQRKKDDKLIKLLNSYPIGLDLLSNEVLDNWKEFTDNDGNSILSKIGKNGGLVRDHLSNIGIDYNNFRVQGEFSLRK